MTNTEQLQALQNAADGLNLTIHIKQYEDKRKKTIKYFADQSNTKNSVSPVLDFTGMQLFLLGWHNALKTAHQ
jgi:hypothetical protein